MPLKSAMLKDCVGSLAMRKSVSVAPDETIAETIALMKREQTGCVLVRDRESLKGLFTERDILTGVLHAGVATDAPIATVMTVDPDVLLPTDTVADVITKMNTGGFRHMPVVDASGNVSGVISVKCIVQYLAEHFPETVYNLPPDPNVLASAREGG